MLFATVGVGGPALATTGALVSALDKPPTLCELADVDGELGVDVAP